MMNDVILGGRGFGRMREHARLVAEAEEKVCEEALQTGTKGVARVEIGSSTHWFVTEAVPYGHIYNFPTQESWDTFRESGDSGKE